MTALSYSISRVLVNNCLTTGVEIAAQVLPLQVFGFENTAHPLQCSMRMRMHEASDPLNTQKRNECFLPSSQQAVERGFVIPLWRQKRRSFGFDFLELCLHQVDLTSLRRKNLAAQALKVRILELAFLAH